MGRWSKALHRNSSHTGSWFQAFGKTLAGVPQGPPLTSLSVSEDTVSPQFGDNQKVFKIRLSDREGRRDAASFLVRRRYAWRGYDIADGDPLHPNWITFSASDYDEIVATIS